VVVAHGIPTYHNLIQKDPKPSPYVRLGSFCYTKGEAIHWTIGEWNA